MTHAPLAMAHEVLGKKWVLGILLACMQGKTRFSEFQQAQPRMSARVLSHRLSMLVARGLLARSGTGKQVHYELTSRGRSARGAILGCLHFGLRANDPSTTLASLHHEWGPEYVAGLFR